jgi:hypothetical protein
MSIGTFHIPQPLILAYQPGIFPPRGWCGHTDRAVNLEHTVLLLHAGDVVLRSAVAQHKRTSRNLVNRSDVIDVHQVAKIDRFW